MAAIASALPQAWNSAGSARAALDSGGTPWEAKDVERLIDRTEYLCNCAKRFAVFEADDGLLVHGRQAFERLDYDGAVDDGGDGAERLNCSLHYHWLDDRSWWWYNLVLRANIHIRRRLHPVHFIVA